MKMRVVLLALGAVSIAAATVSAAMLPAMPAARGGVAAATTWKDLTVSQVAFPANLDIKGEGVFVLRTAAQWDAFWASVPKVTSDGAAVGEPPAVDFSHQFAVVASYGWKSEGYAIAVTHARFNGQQVWVQVDRQQPNPANCRVFHDPFFGGVAIVENPDAAHFASMPVGSSYNAVMEAKWPVSTRDCRGVNH